MAQAYEIDDEAPPLAAEASDVSGTLTRQDPDLLSRLDGVLLGMRRLSVKPPLMSVTLPGATRRIEFATMLACGAIQALTGHDEPVTVKSVAAALDLEHSTASRLLTEAEAEGLVSRDPHPTDRRSSSLALTAQGQEIADAFRQARLRFIAGTLATWSAQDVSAFTDLLDRFVTDVQSQRDCWAEWIADPPA